ncbi:MAG TPA: Mu transposase C-terminal domain-containing protein [Bryobacteraceae bacterium]|jgi:transposase InsO family protein
MPSSANARTSDPVKALTHARRRSDSAAEPPKIQDWTLSPTGKLSGDPAGSLALGMAPAGALNGSEEAQAEAAELFRAFIEPIINPERYADLHRQYPQRRALVEHLAESHHKSARTVYRLLDCYQKKGITGLIRRLRSDKGQPKALNTASVNFIIAAVLPKAGSYGELSIADVFRLHEEERRWREQRASKPLSQAERVLYAGYVDAEGRLLPSAQLSKAAYSTFWRQAAKIPELVKLMARRGQDAYRNAELISFRDYESIQPLDYVVMDHRMLDTFSLVRDGDRWKLARVWLTAAIDMRTRKWLGWCIVETPSSDSIATVLKQVFVRHGLPKSLYWDNGKDFRCHWLEGARERSRTAEAIDGLPKQWTGVLETLDIRVHHAIVKNARAKLIEPSFGRVADFDRTLPEYCGNRPGTRPERFEAELLKEHEAWLAGKRDRTPFRTIEQIAALYNMELEGLNERELHGEGMRKVTPTGYGWMCPNECWENLISRVERRTIPEDVLQLCFAKRRELTVRNGEVPVTFAGRQYHYRLAGNPMALLGLNGRKVDLAYDPLDLEKAAVYFESRFIGLADCVALRHMGEEDFVQDARDRRAARREIKHLIGTIHTAVPVPDPETHLRRRAAVTPPRIEPARVEVPAQLPAPIAEAAAAQAAEAEFSFAATEPSIQAIERAPDADADVEFNFFSDRGD